MAAGITKQIQMDIRGIIRFMVFMEAWVCASCWGLAALLTFMDSQERAAEMKGIRNRPRAGSQTDTSLQSVLTKKFHWGWEPRFRPRKPKSTSSSPSILPARSVVTASQCSWARLASLIST